jgi:hypothetical protein
VNITLVFVQAILLGAGQLAVSIPEVPILGSETLNSIYSPNVEMFFTTRMLFPRLTRQNRIQICGTVLSGPWDCTPAREAQT